MKKLNVLILIVLVLILSMIGLFIKIHMESNQNNDSNQNSKHNVWLETQLILNDISIEIVDIYPTIIYPIFNFTIFLEQAKVDGRVYFALNDYYYSNYFINAHMGNNIFGVYSWAGCDGTSGI